MSKKWTHDASCELIVQRWDDGKWQTRKKETNSIPGERKNVDDVKIKLANGNFSKILLTFLRFDFCSLQRKENFECIEKQWLTQFNSTLCFWRHRRKHSLVRCQPIGCRKSIDDVNKFRSLSSVDVVGRRRLKRNAKNIRASVPAIVFTISFCWRYSTSNEQKKGKEKNWMMYQTKQWINIESCNDVMSCDAIILDSKVDWRDGRRWWTPADIFDNRIAKKKNSNRITREWGYSWDECSSLQTEYSTQHHWLTEWLKFSYHDRIWHDMRIKMKTSLQTRTESTGSKDKSHLRWILNVKVSNLAPRRRFSSLIDVRELNVNVFFFDIHFLRRNDKFPRWNAINKIKLYVFHTLNRHSNFPRIHFSVRWRDELRFMACSRRRFFMLCFVLFFSILFIVSRHSLVAK